MKLKFSLQGAGAGDPDLVATVDRSTTVGQLAEFLVRADPSRHSADRAAEPGALGDFTLALVEEDHRAVDPRATIAESGLRSGVHVAVTRRTSGYADHSRSVAVATVTAGPEQGKEIPLPAGTAYIGRGRGCEVRVKDASVSRKHAKLIVGESVEVLDLGSSNGVLIGDDNVDRAVVGPGDTIRIGETALQVRLTGAASGVTTGEGGHVAFSRSPRIAPVYTGREWDIPELPERGKPQRMPFAMMLVPVFLGAIMFLVTQSAYSLLFMLMMPMMYLGSAWESRRNVKLDFEEAMRDFREDVQFLVEDIEEEHDREEQVRRGEQPDSAECVEAVTRHSPLLWTRRPGEPGFLELRLGTGRLPSRNEIKMPGMGRSKAEAWLELSKQMDGMGAVEGVPVAAEPLERGAIGVAGPRTAALGVARSLLVQAATLHSPSELVIGAIASTASARDWDWLKWLPHTASPHSPITVRHTASSAPACSQLLEEIEDTLLQGDVDRDEVEENGPMATSSPRMVVLVENDAPIDRARLVSLAERGWRRGVVVIWVSPVRDQLPAACRTFIDLGQGDGQALVGFVEDATVVVPVDADTVTADVAGRVARAMSPMADSGALVSDDSDLPRSVSLLSLVGTELASSELDVIERWGENQSVLTGPYAPEVPAKKPGNLRAVVGQSALGTHSVDLRADGPHALVGGTTGSGKSELLQSWILGMAAAHSPQRVTFLLVDYKGGSAFRECVELPHTVGLVTDLSPHLVRRALASLSAELHHREELLARFKAKDLVELERRGEVEAPPSLVIVVDEFAALVQEVPAFVDGVVNIAQRGRSLGLHLVLATQRPAGVIKDNLRANTNLRIALRMADEEDSADVLGSTAAAFFDPALPGRAMVKSGPGRLVPFQAGYAGGWTSDTPPPPEMTVESLAFGGASKWELPAAAAAPETSDLGPTDIKRLVATLRGASQVAELPRPRRPWLPELRDVYDLADLPTARRDDELVFAVGDDPNAQRQPTIAFRPDSEGNLAVYGASGSGKSTFLRSMAVAAGFTVRGGPCHVYGLDFGNRGLSMLEELPHVGSIVNGQDTERVTRLLRMLREEIDGRAVRYSKANASTITEYRRLTGSWEEPRILVLLDGLTGFRQAYESPALQRWLDLFQGLLADGRQVGVHFLLSVDQRNGMPVSMGSAVQSRIVLRMATVEDYQFLGVPADVLTPASPPGRALYGVNEIQCAVLGGTRDVTDQARALAGFGAAMAKAGNAEARPIGSLTDTVPLGDLPVEAGGRPVLGVGATELEAMGFEPKGGFVVTGPSGSGRTSTMATLARSLTRWQPGIRLYLFTLRRSSELLDHDVWERAETTVETIQSAAQELTAQIRSDEGSGPVAVFLERADDLGDSLASGPLGDLAKACVDNDHFVAGEGESGFFSGGFGLPGHLKVSRSGMSLQPDGVEAQMIFRGTFPAYNRAGMPEGRGFLVQRGRSELFQVALPGEAGGKREEGVA